MIRNFITTLFFVLIGLPVFAGSLVRQTESGRVQGQKAAHDTLSWLGVPFAAPPVDELRWKAPVPRPPWTGMWYAKNFSQACPQKGNFFANVPSQYFGEPVGGEDCLYLNIWRPQFEAQGRKLPVVLWIHGGSNFKGTTSDPMYDGAFLANNAQVVFVSVNYRLGLLGAISMKALRGDGSDLDRSGNFVTLDLIRALQWIRDNIDSFNGDPNNITIMGQSAGCMNVWGLLQTPLAEGMFHQAVCSAGIPNSYPRFVAESRSHEFLENLLINAGFATDHGDAKKFAKQQSDEWIHEFMYQRTSDEIVQAQDFLIPFQHISDGVVFPEGLEGVVLGHFNRVPMIIGGTIDEGTYLAGMPFVKVTDKQLWEIMQSPPADLGVSDIIGDTSLATFKAVTKTGSIALWQTLNGLFWGAKAYEPKIWRYSFEWRETPYPWNELFGAVHGMDAMFYLGNFVQDRPSFSRFAWTEDNRASRERLRKTMGRYFRSFFWTGDPNKFVSDEPTDVWERDMVFK